ncbi:MAG TPA: hypothetical protein VF135_02565, partial [Terriglobales bacterium]
MFRYLLTTLVVASALIATAQDVELRTRFRVKYVAADAVYLEGGRNAGLDVGMKLVIRSTSTSADANPDADNTAPQDVTELKVISVASTSAVCEVVSSKRPIAVGDLALIPHEEAEALIQKRALGASRQYPAVISFSEGDPLDEEARAYVPKPPLPEINRARGRIGVDYNSLQASGNSSSQIGMVLRADITRIGGSHWNLSGYWRGRFDSRSSAGQPQTLQDLINRTYHLEMTYVNPESRWVAGFGRLYLPWATSLDTIDGGYVGRRIGNGTTLGLFGGTTPDPTSWNYAPNREIAGSFVNFDGGSYDKVHYTTTFGVAVSALSWTLDRPFGFTETAISYRRILSVYNSLQADSPRTTIPGSTVKPGVSRSYVTLRFQPVRRLSFDLNHNYFRDIPTYDPQLVATGLVDKYLFQGFSGGVRVELPYRVTVYTNVGRSSRSGDAKDSWNRMFGVTLAQIPKTGLHLDAHFSKFDSAFGSGSYRSFSLSRQFGESLRWEVETGNQNFSSPLTADRGSRFVNTRGDFNFGG